MAKTTTDTEQVTVEFARSGNAWLDGGIVGLYRLIRGTHDMPSFLGTGSASTTVPLTDLKDFDNVTVDLSDARLSVSGPSEEVEGMLNRAYDRLIKCYFSLSTKKQIAAKGAYNFYYSTESKHFVAFPKQKPAGAALLLFDKAARPTGAQIKWKNKKSVGRLPTTKEYQELQQLLDKFLAENGLKPGPPAGMLIDGGNEVRPKLLKIRLGGKTSDDACYLSGESLEGLGEAKQTAFPLLGGSRSFVNGSKDKLKIGWKIDFVGKFVPAICFFMQQNEDLHLFFPVAASLKRINSVASRLTPIIDVQENFYRNFNDNLGGFFERRSEGAIAFFHRAFAALSHKDTHSKHSKQRANELSPKTVTATIGGEPDDDVDMQLISARDIGEEIMNHGPVSFAIVSASKKGNVWMPKAFWNYTDIVYLSRLFERMQELVDRSDGSRSVACSPKAFFNSLVDFSAKKDRTLFRDKVCDAILNKRSVLALIERHAFHINRDSGAINTRVGPLLNFVLIYELERFRGTEMEDRYKQMVETATWLGGNIGKGVAEAVKRDAGESAGRGKGAIHRLRKTRTIGDFVNELARLQFRYGIDIPKDVLDGTRLSPDTFAEFRGFCVVSALNRFLYAMKPQTESK